MHYLIEGRIVPERIDLQVAPITFNRTLSAGKIELQIEIIKSKIFLHIEASNKLLIPDIRNIAFTVVGDVVNYAGFKYVLGISYELDSLTDVKEKKTTVFGAEGHVFADKTDLDEKISFKSQSFGQPHQLKNPALLTNTAISRATFELRNSIRYPDFTALHCRLAIEAVRNHFHEKEEKAWPLMRSALNVSKSTILSFNDVSNLQRHGRNIPQSWPQRQKCMQIAWEICSRFIIYLDAMPVIPLANPDYAEL